MGPQPVRENKLKFHDLINFEYPAAFSIHQLILNLPDTACRFRVTVTLLIDRETLTKCIFNNSHLIMPHIALVYLVVIRYLGQIYLTYGLSVIYGVTYKFPVTSTTIRNQINKHLRITVYIQVAYLRIDNRISGYIMIQRLVGHTQARRLNNKTISFYTHLKRDLASGICQFRIKTLLLPC